MSGQCLAGWADLTTIFGQIENQGLIFALLILKDFKANIIPIQLKHMWTIGGQSFFLV